MKNSDYISQLIDLKNAEKVIRKAIDTYSINRKQRDYLFKQLEVIGNKKDVINFKIEICERLRVHEKSR